MGLPYNRLGYAFASKKEQEQLREQFRQEDRAAAEHKQRDQRYKQWRQDCRKRMHAVDDVMAQQKQEQQDMFSEAPSLRRVSAPGGVGPGVSMNRGQATGGGQDMPSLGRPGSRIPSVAGSSFHNLRQTDNSITEGILKKK